MYIVCTFYITVNLINFSCSYMVYVLTIFMVWVSSIVASRLKVSSGICMIMTILHLLLVRNKYSRKVSFHLSLLCYSSSLWYTFSKHHICSVDLESSNPWISPVLQAEHHWGRNTANNYCACPWYSSCVQWSHTIH